MEKNVGESFVKGNVVNRVKKIFLLLLLLLLGKQKKMEHLDIAEKIYQKEVRGNVSQEWKAILAARRGKVFLERISVTEGKNEEYKTKVSFYPQI